MPLWAFLAIIIAAGLALGSGRTFIAAFILLADWAACEIVYILSGNQFVWPALAAIDYTAALFLIVAIPSRISGALAISYVAEGMAHTAYGLSDRGPWAQYEYWQVTHWICWTQAWLALGWGLFNGGKRVRGVRDRLRGLSDRGYGVGLSRSQRNDG